jgi:hypothetical protein
LTVFGSSPAACAISIGARWSGPPAADPPPTGTPPGLAFQSLIRLPMSRYFESLLTTTISVSCVSRAIGVTSESVDGDLFV